MDSTTERRREPSEATPSARSSLNGSAVRYQRPPWLRKHVQMLVLLDALAAAAATMASKALAVGLDSAADLHVRSVHIPYAALMVVSVPTWVAVLATSGSYDVGPLGTGNGEARRVVSAGAHFLAVMAVAYYVLHLQNLGRGFVAAIVPFATVFTLAGRALARYELRIQRLRGHAARRAVVMGLPRNTGLLLDHLAVNPQTGIIPVSVAVPGGAAELQRPAAWPHVPVTDELADATEVVRTLGATGADLLVITGGMTGNALRLLSWHLEGTGVAVMVAPTVAGIAGPQLDVRPLAGLPLLYVDHASLGLAPVTVDADSPAMAVAASSIADGSGPTSGNGHDRRPDPPRATTRQP